MSSGKWRPSCLGPIVLKEVHGDYHINLQTDGVLKGFCCQQRFPLPLGKAYIYHGKYIEIRMIYDKVKLCHLALWISTLFIYVASKHMSANTILQLFRFGNFLTAILPPNPVKCRPLVSMGWLITIKYQGRYAIFRIIIFW